MGFFLIFLSSDTETKLPLLWNTETELPLLWCFTIVMVFLLIYIQCRDHQLMQLENNWFILWPRNWNSGIGGSIETQNFFTVQNLLYTNWGAKLTVYELGRLHEHRQHGGDNNGHQ
jgi:hypothetical protein